MRYPAIWRKIVNAFALLSGCLAVLTGILSVFEAIMRYFLTSPTSWTLTVSQYILLYLAFFASPYAFQEGGHVAIDIARIAADKIETTGKLRRAMATFGYCAAIAFVVFLAKSIYVQLATALKYGKMTTSIPIIPMWALYLPMLFGLALMTVTLIFMILDLYAKDGTGKYL